MQYALSQAQQALEKGWIPIGAVFVKNDCIITYGRKDGMHHPHFDHAEHNGCYRALPRGEEGVRSDLSGVTVYTTLEPCIMCIGLLMTTRVSRIVYGLNDPYGGGGFILSSHVEGCLPERFQQDRPELCGGVLENKSRALLRKFFEKQKKKSKGTPWSTANNALVRHVMWS